MLFRSRGTRVPGDIRSRLTPAGQSESTRENRTGRDQRASGGSSVKSGRFPLAGEAVAGHDISTFPPSASYDSCREKRNASLKSLKQLLHIQCLPSTVTKPSCKQSGSLPSQNFVQQKSQWSWSHSGLGGEYARRMKIAPDRYFCCPAILQSSESGVLMMH